MLFTLFWDDCRVLDFEMRVYGLQSRDVDPL